MEMEFSLDLIAPNPWQTRESVDEAYIKELAEDIATHGLLQVPLGRLAKHNGEPLDEQVTSDLANNIKTPKVLAEYGYQVQLAFGHNRLAAYRYAFADRGAGWGKMPVEIRFLSDDQMSEYAWAENERRRDLTPLERAKSIQRRINDFGWTQEQAGKKLGLSRSAVANILMLLKLPEEAQAALQAGQLTERQAQALKPLYDLPESIRQAAEAANDYYSRDVKPSKIIEAAMKGESSAETRTRINRIISNFSENLSNAHWPLDFEDWFYPEQAATAIIQSSCVGCPSSVKREGEERCLEKSCYMEKQTIWRKKQLDQAVQASGIPALEDDHGGYYTDFSYEYNHVPQLVQAGCENLRLEYSPGTDKYREGRTLKAHGFPDVIVVCKKRNGFCSCLEGAKLLAKQEEEKERLKKNIDQAIQERADETGDQGLAEFAQDPWSVTPQTPPTAEELQKLVKDNKAAEKEAKKLNNEFRQKMVGVVIKALARNDPAAWRWLASSIYWQFKLDEIKEWDVAKIQGALANHYIREPYDGEKALKYQEAIRNELTEAGIDVAGGQTLAEVFYTEAEAPA